MNRFVTLNEVLPQAKKDKKAIGHFNMNGQQWAEGILLGAQTEKNPVIIATSDRVVDYLGGFKLIAKIVEGIMDQLQIDIPVVLHLDHGQSVKRCLEALEAGYSSVMIDGSHFPIEENIKMTQIVTKKAHDLGASVEAEIGTVGGVEDGLTGGINYADFDECLRLIEETNIDALAAALGSVHGRYIGKPKLGFKEMEKLSQSVDTPLVLHGASGIPDDQIKKAISLGHAKINVNTELNLAWKTELINQLESHHCSYEPKIFLEPAKYAIQKAVQNKIRLFSN